MHAILRRYEGVDSSRSVELARNVDEKFIPKLNELPGFSGYYLIEAGNGVMTSVSVFETAEQADKSHRIHLGAGREAREGSAESAQDHVRRGRRA